MAPLYQEETSKFKYLILLASFFDHVIIYGIAYGAGVFQVIFLEEFGNVATSGTTSIVTSLVTTLTFFTGPISSTLTNRYGCRIVSWIGTMIAFFGLLFTSQVTSFWQLYITFSLIGVGFGIAYIPCVMIICQYYERRRPIAVAIACMGLGIGTFIMPPLIRFLVNVYHWRNAVLILSALTLNMAVCASLFRPVTVASISEGLVSKKKIIRVKMLRQFSFWCLLLNNFLIMFGMITFYIHLPAYLGIVKYSDDQGALFVSLIGAGAITGRLMTGVFTQWLNVPLMLYMISMGFSGIMVILVPFFHQSTPLGLLTFLFGLSSASIGPLLPLIIAELVGSQAVSDGFGYVLVAEGVGSLLGPPVAGFLYDLTLTYTLSMVLSGMVLIVASIVMLPPWWNLRKNKPLTENESIARTPISDSNNES